MRTVKKITDGLCRLLAWNPVHRGVHIRKKNEKREKFCGDGNLKHLDTFDFEKSKEWRREGYLTPSPAVLSVSMS